MKIIRRKLASLKTFFRYLEYKAIIETNPFNKIRTKLREPLLRKRQILRDFCHILCNSSAM